jgi:hypothetical protein
VKYSPLPTATGLARRYKFKIEKEQVKEIQKKC